MTQLPDRHPQGDFFIPDMFDSLGASFKDDMASMEHPLFSLSKKKDMRQIVYRSGNSSITITPTLHGLPTIFDKDIVLYCASLLMTEVNAGRIPPRTLRISCHDLMKSTNRPTDGHGYKNLKQALDRLTGVKIKTNIKTNGREQTDVFGVLDGYRVVESSRIKDRMIRLEITVADWFYNSVIGKEVLTIDRAYFRLGKPVERRLYEIARKFCGRSSQWKIDLAKLMEKTGSSGTLRRFRHNLNIIANDDHLPEYSLSLDSSDTVTFTNKNAASDSQGALALDDMPRISPATLEKARRIVSEAETGWDFYALQEQFTLSLQGGFAPDNANGAFIAFVKKKVQDMP